MTVEAVVLNRNPPIVSLLEYGRIKGWDEATYLKMQRACKKGRAPFPVIRVGRTWAVFLRSGVTVAASYTVTITGTNIRTE